MVPYVLTFFAGFVLGAAVISLVLLLRFLAQMRDLRRAKARAVFVEHLTERDLAAKQVIDGVKSKMRWNKNVNPEWFAPLLSQVPIMVKDIAKAYHPECPDPLLAPGLSSFTKAIQLAAKDITDFLEQRAVGRLIDVSAHTVYKTWEKGSIVVSHPRTEKFMKWYRRVLPYWQAVSFKSPLTWASLFISNVAIRTLQPAIIDIVARRAVELYSGKFDQNEMLALQEQHEELEQEVIDASLYHPEITPPKKGAPPM